MTTTELVIPKDAATLRNTTTGETYPYVKIEESHPPKVEVLHVKMPDGTLVRAMCLSVEEGYAVYFQGIVH